MRTIRNGSFGQRIGLGSVIFMLLCCASTGSFAADNLECPEIGPGRVPDLIGDTTGAGLFPSENFIDLANEINAAISALEISSPDISLSTVQDVLIAAYCRVVAREPGLSAAEKWSRMRQFTGVLEREIATVWASAQRQIVARVPLAPDVYREIQTQATASHLTVAQLMAAFLAHTAGK
jgi:hypothetical protein